MRVVVGSGSPGDPRQAEIDRHVGLMSRFAAWTAAEHAAPRALTMILRSAESGPAQALIAMKHELSRAGASAKVIVAKLEPEEAMRQLYAGLSELAPQQPAAALIRWARNPLLLDAHEQVTYGQAMCWSGDAMRRGAERRNALTLLDDASPGAPGAVRLGQLAFAALWSASVPVPERALVPRGAPLPSGAYEQSKETPVTVSPLRPGPQGWPLVRH